MNKLAIITSLLFLFFACHPKTTKQIESSKKETTTADSIWTMQTDGSWKKMPQLEAPQTPKKNTPSTDSVWTMQADGSWKKMPQPEAPPIPKDNKTNQSQGTHINDGDYIYMYDKTNSTWVKVTEEERAAAKKSTNRFNILKPGKKYYYEAIQKDANGKLLSKGQIGMIATGKIGTYQSDDPSYFIWEMNYSEQDSINLHQQVFAKSTKKWIQQDTTSATVDKERFYIHPIRENQYYKLEVAPHPQIKFPVKAFTVFDSKVYIMKNFGIFDNSKTESIFEYQDIEKRSLPIGDVMCYKFVATAENSKVGKSSLEFYFNEQYGFVEKYYTTYDGETVEFKLVKFVDDSVKK